jgi:hypothetical protein
MSNQAVNLITGIEGRLTTPAAGEIGEIISAEVTVVTQATPVTNTLYTLVTLPIPPGVWSIEGSNAVVVTCTGTTHAYNLDLSVSAGSLTTLSKGTFVPFQASGVHGSSVMMTGRIVNNTSSNITCTLSFLMDTLLSGSPAVPTSVSNYRNKLIGVRIA